MKATKHLNLISLMLLILSILLLLNLKSQAQILGVPLDAIKRELKDIPYTETQQGDTTVLEWNARSGHVFFIRFESMPQRWYFHNGVSVYVEGTQSRYNRVRDRRILRREWNKYHDIYMLGHRAVWLNPDGNGYVKWVRSEGK